MRCILRAAGMIFDADAFLQSSALRANGVYHSGESRGADSGASRYSGSGFNVTVVDADSVDHVDQFAEVARFLDIHENEIRRLGSYPGVELVCLEFVFAFRDSPIQSETFPADLLWRAGALDVDIVTTHYAASSSAA
ncbi:MAG: hypothetical protein JXO72_10880, partial [Vicinamibacteria bacterium]|nr:hypothetical protein [Vicinamibacteria bacterium]